MIVAIFFNLTIFLLRWTSGKEKFIRFHRIFIEEKNTHFLNKYLRHRITRWKSIRCCNNSETKYLINVLLLALLLLGIRKKKISSVCVYLYMFVDGNTLGFSCISALFYRSQHKFRPFISFALEYETFECGTNKENPRIRLQFIHFNNKMENLVCGENHVLNVRIVFFFTSLGIYLFNVFMHPSTLCVSDNCL